MVSLKDIAQRTGASITVVSRVLRNQMGNTRVRPELAERIRQTARRMGYRPNPAAVSLVSGRQFVLGMLIQGVGLRGSGITEAMVQGASIAARQINQRLSLAFYNSAEQLEESLVQIDRGGVDGLLVMGRVYEQCRVRLIEVREQGLPIVTLHHRELDPSLPNVGLEQALVARLATQHLLDRGCRRIAWISTDLPRYAGYEFAHMHAGVEPTPELVLDKLNGGLSYEAGEQAVRALLAQGLSFDGVVSQSDAQALGVLNELAAHGTTCPAQVRVIGVDNSPYCPMLRPSLSSICQQYHERARQAVSLLQELIDRRSPCSVTFEPVLHARESTR